MKTDISYLPENKQAELRKVTMLIKQVVPSEMIILFGSYARNAWVEDKYDEEHFRYISDCVPRKHRSYDVIKQNNLGV